MSDPAYPHDPAQQQSVQHQHQQQQQAFEHDLASGSSAPPPVPAATTQDGQEQSIQGGQHPQALQQQQQQQQQQRLEIDPALVAASEAASGGYSSSGQQAAGKPAARGSQVDLPSPDHVAVQQQHAGDIGLIPEEDDTNGLFQGHHPPELNLPTPDDPHGADPYANFTPTHDYSSVGLGEHPSASVGGLIASTSSPSHGAALHQQQPQQQQHLPQQQQQRQQPRQQAQPHLGPPQLSSGVVPLIRPKKANQRGGPGGGSVNETGLRKPANQLRNEGRPPKGVTQCASCGLKESPEWRKGESGIKDLCNACGLRYARLVAKRAGKIRPRKKKDKSFGAEGADGGESSNRGGKRARVGETEPSPYQLGGGPLDPQLFSQHQHPYQGYYGQPTDGSLQPGHPQHPSVAGGHSTSSPHQLPPIDAPAYGASSSAAQTGFYAPTGLHPQLQQQHLAQSRISSPSPAGGLYNAAAGASNGGQQQQQQQGQQPQQLPPIGSSAYPMYGNNAYYAAAAQLQQQHQQQQQQSHQPLSQALGGQYPYYGGQPNTGAYDPQLQQVPQQQPKQQQQVQQPQPPRKSSPGQPSTPQESSPARAAPPQQQQFYAPPPFSNYGYQMQQGHVPDGFVSGAQAASSSTAGGGTAALGGTGQPSQQRQQQQQSQQSSERGAVPGSDQARAPEGTTA